MQSSLSLSSRKVLSCFLLLFSLCYIACSGPPFGYLSLKQCSEDEDCLKRNYTCVDGTCKCSLTVCPDKSCQAQCCPKGHTLCGKVCVQSLQTDANHCGKCDHACFIGQNCTGGKCQCPTGSRLCGEECLPETTACCAKGQKLCRGLCIPEATPCCLLKEETVCSDVCVDLELDDDNCGKCGRACPTNAECYARNCQCKHEDDDFCNGKCVNIFESKDHCGKCGRKCLPPKICCEGACINPLSNSTHCGKCEQTCESDEACCRGKCTDRNMSLLGHQSAITGLAFSPNGELLATASTDRSIRLWSTDSGAHLATLTSGHVASLLDLTYSANGKLIATTSDDQTLRIWEASNGATIVRLRIPTAIRRVAFHPKKPGTYVIGYGDNQHFYTFNTKTKKISPGINIAYPVQEIRFHPDGTHIFIVDTRGRIHRWIFKDSPGDAGFPTVKADKNIFTPKKGSGEVAWSADRKVFAMFHQPEAGNTKGTIEIWDVEQKKIIKTIQNSSVGSLALDAKGEWLAVGKFPGRVEIWELKSATLSDSFVAHTSADMQMAFSNDRRFLFTGGDYTFRLWLLNQGKYTLRQAALQQGLFKRFSLRPDGKEALVGDTLGTLQSHKIPQMVKSLSYSSQRFSGVHFVSDSKLMAVGYQGKFEFWDIKRKIPADQPISKEDDLEVTISKIFRDGQFPPVSIHSSFITQDKKKAIIGSSEQHKALREYTFGATPPMRLLYQGNSIKDIIPFGDKGLIGAVFKGYFQLFDPQKKQLLSTPNIKGVVTGCAAMHPSGKYLFLGHPRPPNDIQIKVYSVKDWKVIISLPFTFPRIHECVFDADGRFFAVTFGKSARLIRFDDRDGKLSFKAIKNFYAHDNHLRHVQFSKDKRYMGYSTKSSVFLHACPQFRYNR